MSNGFRSFSSQSYSKNTEPAGFEIDGVSYKCVSNPPAIIWETISGDNIAPNTVIQFLAQCIESEDDVTVFRQAISRKEDPVPLELLTDIVVHLIEVYAGRPTQRPTDSSDGPGAEEASSTVISLPTEQISTT